jgi:hypothetical protein
MRHERELSRWDQRRPSFEVAHRYCDTVKTYFRDDVRLYPYLPRKGDSKAAALRQALLLRRNAVESVFSSIQNLGIGIGGKARIKWGGDIEMEWVLSLCCAFFTARHIAHETGGYEAAYEDAIARGLLRAPRRGTRTPLEAVAKDLAFPRMDAQEPGLIQLLSWQRHLEEQALAAEHDVSISLRQRIEDIGEFDVDPELDPYGHLYATANPTQDNRELRGELHTVLDPDAPLLADDLDEEEYLKAYGDVDLSAELEAFDFEPDAKSLAIDLAENLGVGTAFEPFLVTDNLDADHS